MYVTSETCCKGMNCACRNQADCSIPELKLLSVSFLVSARTKRTQETFVAPWYPSGSRIPRFCGQTSAVLQAEARAAADQSASSAKLRHAGNKAFQRGRVEEAVRLYSEARLSIAVTPYINRALLCRLLHSAAS